MTEKNNSQQPASWLDQPVFSKINLTWESVIFGGILLLAVLSRFYDLGSRVMSHDETSHVYYAWRLFKGMGYSHTPITHGPFQFHILALSYFLFGDSDFSARIPAVLFSIATIAFIWRYRRYLGKYGTLAAAGMTLISPFMLYYGRYVRNEAFVALFGVVVIWAILRYLETSAPRYLYWMTAATMLHFTAKETSFIYTAQAMLFLGFFFIHQILKREWNKPKWRNRFIIALIVTALMLGTAFLSNALASANLPEGEELAAPPLLTIVGLLIAGLSLVVALLFSIRGYTWQKLCQLPSFSALLLLGTLVLPHLAPFPVRFLNMDPTDYTMPGILRTGIAIAILSAIGIAFGLAWNPKVWLINAAIFYVPFLILYTTLFSNMNGLATGLVGSLGYWLEQQGVERGSQPWYYYWLIQIPIYEYLPALLSFTTMLGVGGKRLFEVLKHSLIGSPNPEKEEETSSREGQPQAPVFALLAFWTLSSFVAYPIAGEKMPWLTVHIAFPMILMAGWGFQRLVSKLNVARFRENHGWVIVLLLIVFLISASALLGNILGTNPPFQGQELAQLESTNQFITTFLMSLGSGVGLFFLLKHWRLSEFLRTASLVLLVFLAGLTVHTAVQATYINYDNPTEYLVYAHSARGVKEALSQIEEISRRISDGLSIQVAYDNETTYPYWWYLRNYTNQDYYGENPTRKQRNAPVILVGDNNFGKIEPVVGNAYYQFDYNRIWWPDQGYFNLTWSKIGTALRNPTMREAIFDIWMYRDYTKYGQVKGQDMSLSNWSPADRMRLYVRKDIAAKVWNLGTAEGDFEELLADPYEGKEITLEADQIIAPETFQQPRNAAFSPDGTLYVVDSGNHRVVHLTPDGEILHTWGSFSAIEGNSIPPGGTFNEPWGIAVGPEGNVYVADTWNHRVQKFSPEGEFISSWGYFGQRETPEAFWGPRDIAVSEQGLLYISDTGNKRIAVFDVEGNFISDFGEAGLGPGQFDEPVGLALDAEGRLYVADTWNQRIQVFSLNDQGIAANFETEWEINGWFGQSLDNKPYLTVGGDGNVYISDPEAIRILVFSPEGTFLRYWGTFGEGPGNLNLPTGLAADPEGGLWVVDTGNNRMLHFTPPTE
jgi:predicted membrane-bound mannosyltransferase/DNA-binding beta-propeller fold protein YncE